MYVPVLAGAGGSPPLFRCDLRARGVEDPQFGHWRNAKNVGFTRVVSVMRAARTCIIRIFQ